MVTGISFGGLASGLNTEDMLEKPMHLQRAPIRQLLVRKDAEALRQEAWQGINLLLSGLDAKATALRGTATFDGRTVTSSHVALLGATATRGAAEDTYEVEIQQMAGVHRMASDRIDSRTDALEMEGFFVIGGIEIQIAAEDSLNDIRDRINAEGVGVGASVVDNHLLLTGAETGAGNRIGLYDVSGGVLEGLGLLTGVAAWVEVEGFAAGAVEASEEGIEYSVAQFEDPVLINGSSYHYGLADAEGNIVGVSLGGGSYVALDEAVSGEEMETAVLSTEIFEFQSPVTDGTVTATVDGGVLTLNGTAVANELAEPRDALFSVDGLQIASSGNTGIGGIIDGVTLDLGGVTGAETVTLEIGRDLDTAVEMVREFVMQYNQIAKGLKDLGGRNGLLQGDGTLRRLETGLRRLVMDNVGLEDAEYTHLGQLGIAIDRERVMILDEAKLTAALQENPGAVRTLFEASEDIDGADGVARRLGEYMHNWIRHGDGVLAGRDRMYDRTMRMIDDRVESLERRVQMREANLRRQFVRMEEMLSAMHTQGQWLEGQINTLSSLRRDST